jgi:hypothetical protein
MVRILELAVVFILGMISLSSLALADITITLDVLPTAISLNITSPTNTTYTSIPILLSGDTNINGDISFSVNGNSNQTACLDCTSFSNSISGNITAGGNRIDVYAVDSSNSTNADMETVYFTYSPPAPPQAVMLALVPTAMGAGYIIFLVGLFIGSPKTPKELAEFTMAGVIIGLVVVSAIGIIIGLI